MEYLLGLIILLLSIVLVLPVPLGNMLPALAVSVLSISLIQRDGLIALLGKGPVEPDGRQLLLLSFTPARLSPGRYALRVILQDGATGRGTQASTPFLVR